MLLVCCAVLQNRVKDPQLINTWNTAAQYHLMHSLLLTVTPLLSGASHTYSTRLLSAGIVLFSGSLYALVLTGEKRLGAVAPIGGTALIAGWSEQPLTSHLIALSRCCQRLEAFILSAGLLTSARVRSAACWTVQGCFGASEVMFCWQRACVAAATILILRRRTFVCATTCNTQANALMPPKACLKFSVRLLSLSF